MKDDVENKSCDKCAHLKRFQRKEKNQMYAYGCSGTVKGYTPYISNDEELSNCTCQLMENQISIYKFLK